MQKKRYCLAASPGGARDFVKSAVSGPGSALKKNKGLQTKIRNVMRWTAVFLTAAFIHAHASGMAQNVTLSGKDLSLKQIFTAIEQQTGFVVFCNEQTLSGVRPVTLAVHNLPLRDLLNAVIKNQPLDYTIEDKTIILSRRPLPGPSPSTIYPLTIRVSNTAGEPLAGASVTNRNSGSSGVTDADGRVGLNVFAGDVIEISFVGFKTQSVTIKDDASNLSVTLERLVSRLEEVTIVNTGYEFIPKDRVTGSFAQPLKEVFNSRVSSDVLSRLNGITSGLIFNANTGNTINGSLDISIRGRSTINANDQPLIVVDNFPYNGDISNINPNDVASVTVLKDAAAAAVWGVRAGNGVIVITTKKGKTAQPPKLGLTSSITFMKKPDLFYNPNFLPSSAYIDIEHFLFSKGRYNADLANTVSFPVVSPAVEIMYNGGRYTTTDSVRLMEQMRSTDVRQQNSAFFFRPAIMQQHAMNVSGGTERHTYYLSAGFDKNLQSLRYNDLERISLNMSNVFRPLKDLELTAGLYFINTSTNTDDTYRQIVSRSYTYYPYLQYAAPDGSPLAINRYQRESYITSAPSRGFQDWAFRPLQELGLTDNKSVQADFRVLTGIRYRVAGGLYADVRYQHQRVYGGAKTYYPAESFAARSLVNQYARTDNGVVTGYNVPVGGYMEVSDNKAVSHNFRAALTFTKSTGPHTINALGGYEISEYTGEGRSAAYYGYNHETGTYGAVDYLSAFPLNPSGTANIPGSQSVSGTIDRFRSVFGSGAYTYNGKYTLTLSGRLDGSNYFGVSANQKSVPLWAAGGKWNLDAEEFYHISWLPVLKLTATYGYNGNLDRATTGITTFRYFNNAQLTGLQYADLTNIGNPDLRWERSRQIKTGIDFATSNRTISGNLEYYFKKGLDLIGSTWVAPNTGLVDYRGNYAEMKGSGFDLTLHAQPLSGSFDWKTSLLLNYNRDEVTRYNISVTTAQFLAADGLNGKSIVPITGRPVYSVFSLPFAGLDPENGDPRGYLNGAVSKNYTALNQASFDQLQYHGPARPRFSGGLSNAFYYKNFSLLVNINFKLGYFFRRSSIDYYQLTGNSFRVHKDYLNRWQAPGDEVFTNVPSMPYPSNLARDRFYGNTSVLVERGDHIRLQDIHFAYTFKKEHWRALPFRDAQLFAYLNNIGLIWKANKAGLDPDFVPRLENTTTPVPVSIAFGIKANI